MEIQSRYTVQTISRSHGLIPNMIIVGMSEYVVSAIAFSVSDRLFTLWHSGTCLSHHYLTLIMVIQNVNKTPTDTTGLVGANLRNPLSLDDTFPVSFLVGYDKVWSGNFLTGIHQ